MILFRIVHWFCRMICRYRYVIITCFVIPTLLLCLFVFVCTPKECVAVGIWQSWLTFSGSTISSSFPYDPMHSMKLWSWRSRISSADLVHAFSSCVGMKTLLECFPQERRLFPMERLEFWEMWANVTEVYEIAFSLITVKTSRIYNAFRSFPSGHSATSVNALLTILQMLFHYIDETFNKKQYQVRNVKTILSVPFISWVCFILGSRIVGFASNYGGSLLML